MKKRPLSIRLLSLAFFLSPLGLVLEMIYYYKIPADNLKVFLTPLLWTPQVVAMAVLTPLVGLCVWSVQPWGYIVLLVYSGLILVNNIVVWVSAYSMSGIVERIALTLGFLFLVLVEVRKEFSSPYFNPRLRWWEQAHRFATDKVRIVVKEFDKDVELFQAQSFDVSATGIYVVSGHEVKIGDLFGMDVILPGNRVHHTTAEVVWAHGGSDRNPQGFGCRFAGRNPRFRKEMRAAIRQLHADMKNR